MLNISNFSRQHDEIYKSIYDIEALIKNNTIEKDAMTLGKLISLLSGKLKVHLQSEDNFLYPNLLNSGDSKLKTITQSYIDEMGNLKSVFEDYKNNFNTKNKICADINAFKIETSKILNALKNRLNKEDNNLYTLLK
ncbi:hemerythrin domain-containing protein [Clostridium hydrogeniformans]|uniref:hemerythrin domain-containing protein n=1 Tax=Clostridium hydrogeniformans TaxID=349933 RepID=UPI000485E6B7|nr:hemerythrin domain-containing protein [Clostridium hydrogeniformans]